jgi:hypothetical protein
MNDFTYITDRNERKIAQEELNKIEQREDELRKELGNLKHRSYELQKRLGYYAKKEILYGISC